MRLVLFFFVLVSVQFCSGKESAAIKAGQMDLRSWDFDRDGIVKLSGTWQCRWGYDYGKDSSIKTSLPSEMVSVPSYWNKPFGKKFGIATYRATVIVPDSYPLMMYIPRQQTSYRVYINDTLIAESGKPGCSKSETIPLKSISVSPLLYADTLNISVIIANYEDINGGFSNSILLGTYQSIYKYRSLQDNINFSIIAFIAMAVIYHLFLWWQRSGEISFLYFSLAGLLVILRILVVQSYIETFFANDWIYYVARRLDKLSIICIAMVFMKFFASLFPQYFNKKMQQYSVGAGLVICLFIIAFPPAIHSQGIAVFFAFVLLNAVWIIISLLKEVQEKNGIAIVVLSGIAFQILCSLNDTLVANGFYQGPYITKMGMVFFILMQAVVLSYRFQKAFSVAEHLTHNLQQEIDKQTATLNSQKISIESMNRELQEKDTYKTKFFHNITHEFKTPLTLIQGTISMVLSGSYGMIDQQVKKQLQIAKGNSERLHWYINQILDLARLDTKNISVKLSQFDATIPIQSVFDSFVPYAQHRGTAMRLSGTNRLWVQFDQGKLETILINLLSNAVKSTTVNDSITITVTESPDRFDISVADTGSGIKAKELPYIFERFRQAGNNPQLTSQGTGIGLAIVQEYVQLLGGKVHVQSTYGKGSTFTISLPKNISNLSGVTIEHAADTEEICKSNIDQNKVTSNPADTVVLQQHKWTVAIIEDNDDMRWYLKQVLGKFFNIIEAKDGHQGLHSIETNMPDLVISDVMMPTIDGIELSDRLGNNQKTDHIPVILVTALSDEPSQQKGIASGAVDYITKPFMPDLLIRKVTNIMRVRDQQQQQFLQRHILQGLGNTEPLQQNSFMDKVVSAIRDNINNPNLDLGFLSSSLGYSSAQLHRKVKSLTGIAPGELIRNIRLGMAKDMLDLQEENNYSITDIAYSVGFRDPSYFTKAFKKKFNKAPSEY